MTICSVLYRFRGILPPVVTPEFYLSGWFGFRGSGHIQKAEYEAAFAPVRNPPFSPDRPVEQVEGDRDVFGDGAVTLISTPGHTSGHQSLLVNLEQTGWVVLAGDAMQVKEQWDRWHASPGSYPERLAPSMARLADGGVRAPGPGVVQPRPGPNHRGALGEPVLRSVD